MYSCEPGVYSAKGQPDVVVTYGGEIVGDDAHHGPWVQWRFAWETRIVTTFFSEFKEMVEQAGYTLATPKPSEGFKSGAE